MVEAQTAEAAREKVEQKGYIVLEEDQPAEPLLILSVPLSQP